MRVAVRVALGAPALLALALSSAHAQPAESRLPTAVVTPSRTVQSIDDALPSTTVTVSYTHLTLPTTILV